MGAWTMIVLVHAHKLVQSMEKRPSYIHMQRTRHTSKCLQHSEQRTVRIGAPLDVRSDETHGTNNSALQLDRRHTRRLMQAREMCIHRARTVLGKERGACTGHARQLLKPKDRERTELGAFPRIFKAIVYSNEIGIK